MIGKLGQMSFDINVYLKLENYTVKRLKEEDLCHIQILCEKSKDYFILDQGTEPNEHTSKDILDALPPGKNIKDKYVVGYFDKEMRLVALVDMIKDYPISKTWFLGLLLIDPSFRDKGLGIRIHKNIVNWIAVQGGKSINIGVLENNNAIMFWEKSGYTRTETSEQKRNNKEDRSILLMAYLINKTL